MPSDIIKTKAILENRDMRRMRQYLLLYLMENNLRCSPVFDEAFTALENPSV